MRLGLGLNLTNARGSGIWIPPGAGNSLALYLPPPDTTQFWDAGSGGGLKRWHDYSGNDEQVTQDVIGNQPAFEVAGFNGLPCFLLEKANSTHLFANGVASLASGTKTPWVIAELIEKEPGSGAGASFCFGADASADPLSTVQIPNVGSETKYRIFRRNDAGSATDNTTSTPNIPNATMALISEFDPDSSELRVYKDDAASPWDTLAVDASGACTFDNFVLGAQYSNGALSQPVNQRKRTVIMWSGIGSLESIAAGTRASVMSQLLSIGGITP